MEQEVYNQLMAKLREVMAAYPDFHIYAPNEGMDLAALPDSWVKVELDFDDIDQASLGHTPLKLYTGSLVVGIYVKEGEGIFTVTQVKEALSAEFTCKTHGAVILANASNLKPAKVPTFFGTGMIYRFQCHLLPS